MRLWLVQGTLLNFLEELTFDIFVMLGSWWGQVGGCVTFSFQQEVKLGWAELQFSCNYKFLYVFSIHPTVHFFGVIFWSSNFYFKLNLEIIYHWWLVFVYIRDSLLEAGFIRDLLLEARYIRDSLLEVLCVFWCQTIISMWDVRCLTNEVNHLLKT